MTNEEAAGALEELTILDLSEGVAGPFAAKLFADNGARVIKVERPGIGDRSRNEGPFIGDAGPELSALFLALNTSKLSLTLDYETAEGAAVLSRLAEDADGIIEDLPSRRRADLGLDALTLRSRIPRLVIVGLAPPPDESYKSLGGRRAAYETGLHAFVATMTALWYAAQTEKGQVVEVDPLTAVTSTTGAPLAHALYARQAGAAASASTWPPADAATHLVDASELPELYAAEHPVAGELRLPADPFVFSATPGQPGRAPLLGEHTDYVLGDLIEMDAADIETLRRAGVV